MRVQAYAGTDTQPDRIVVGVVLTVAVTGCAMAPAHAATPGGAEARTTRVESGDMGVDVTVREPVASTRLTWLTT
jgi:hypothetical protein